jgi:hypothetical protein
VAYQDKVEGAEFVEFLRRRLILVHELLSSDGTLYVHLDTKKVHYMKVVLDEIFGEHNFRNEIIWKRSDAHSDARQGGADFGRIHDTILRYTKTEKTVFNVQHLPLPETTVSKWYRNGELEAADATTETDRTACLRGVPSLPASSDVIRRGVCLQVFGFRTLGWPVNTGVSDPRRPRSAHFVRNSGSSLIRVPDAYIGAYNAASSRPLPRTESVDFEDFCERLGTADRSLTAETGVRIPPPLSRPTTV